MRIHIFFFVVDAELEKSFESCPHKHDRFYKKNVCGVENVSLLTTSQECMWMNVLEAYDDSF